MRHLGNRSRIIMLFMALQPGGSSRTSMAVFLDAQVAGKLARVCYHSSDKHINNWNNQISGWLLYAREE